MTGTDLFTQYKNDPGIYDEMCHEHAIRSHYSKVFEGMSDIPVETLQQKDLQAGELFMNHGITFTVYNDDVGIERIFPFDIIPRILTSAEWEHIEKGIKQRLRALNLFLKDIYSAGKIRIRNSGLILRIRNKKDPAVVQRDQRMEA